MNIGSQQPTVSSFSFGDPEPVLSSSLIRSLGVFLDASNHYYSPPVDLNGLSNLRRANAHHCTIPFFRRNLLCKWYIENGVLSSYDLGCAAYDFDIFGNCYFHAIRNRFGVILTLKHLPALYMRRMKQLEQYCILQRGKSPMTFPVGEVIHLMEYDPDQQIYGIPQYLGGINSVLLNESSTLFRRRYYDNGAHMGYVFYTADANFEEEDEEALREQIANSKGVGNFRSMFINIPGGKPDSVKIIPVGDIATKDEFERVKNLSRNDVLSMWRIQPALAGVMPDNAGGFGDIEKIGRVYHEYEIEPFQKVFLRLNEYLTKNKKLAFTEMNAAA